MTLQLTGHVALPEHKAKGGFDHAAVHAASGHVYVAHTANDAVDVFDPASRRYLFSIPGLPGVAGALVSDEGELIFSSNRAANTIGVFAPGPDPSVRIIDVGRGPNGLAYDPAPADRAGGECRRPGGARLAHFVDDRPCPGREAQRDRRARPHALDRVRSRAGTLLRQHRPAGRDRRGRSTPARPDRPQLCRAPAGPHGLDLDGATQRLFCACDAGVLVTLDARSGKVLDEKPLSGVPDVVLFNRQRQHLYVAIGDPGVIDVFSTAPDGEARNGRNRDGCAYHRAFPDGRPTLRLSAAHAPRRDLRDMKAAP